MWLVGFFPHFTIFDKSPGRVRRRSAEVALVSARLRGTQGGGVSPPDSPSRAVRSLGREPVHPACMRGFGGEAPRLAPAVSSGSDHLAGHATEWGGLPGGRARSAPAPRGVGAPRSEGGGAAAAHWLPTRPPSTGAAPAEMIVLSGCTGGGLPAGMPCDDCTEWMYW